MGRKFRDMKTPEQQYAERQAGALAQVLYSQAHAADEQAQMHQMTADVYGREGRDYSDPTKARRAARDADMHRKRRDDLLAKARKQKQIADEAAKPKRRRWF